MISTLVKALIWEHCQNHGIDFALFKIMLHILLLIIFFHLSIIRRIPCNQICYKTCLHHKRWLVWLVPLAQVWTHYKIRKFNMWTLFCNVCINFLNNQIWKEIMLELNGIKATMSVYVGNAWKILPIIARSLWCLSVCGDKQGQDKERWPGQPLRGAKRGAISIKEILGENRGTYI